MNNIHDFDNIVIQLASPEKILEWSYGEVEKPETINYRTLRPERGGLFCEKIFGTTKEWECYCGKYKSKRYAGVVCERCGVEVTHFKVRRERMGRIDLASPVSHIWYYRTVPSRIGLLLDMTMNDLRSVLYFERYIVTDPGDTNKSKYDLIKEAEYNELKMQYENTFEAGIGAEIIKQILSELDLEKIRDDLREQMLEKGGKSNSRLLKRLGIVEDFIGSNNKPEWMILDRIPVIPPELRPMVQLDGGRFATSDLNDLYRRVINRNNRLKRLMDLMAPEIIIRNEKRMLQEAVDALFDNSRRKRPIKGSGNRPLKSLSDMLKGKQGRFRQNLLGKRVDYSGRSVIIVGPELKMHQCGLPKKMALELFKPFIMKRLKDKGIVHNIKSAKKKVENAEDEVWAILEEVVSERPVILNRAPTLHRLGVQAFEPVLVDTKAIKLHPLVCQAFNADFDGDQMAVHVPLSLKAQIESWFLMLSSKNLLNPANGQPIVGPTQDMVLGIHYLTKLDKRIEKSSHAPFVDYAEVEMAYELGYVKANQMIDYYLNDGLIETTAGRVLFSKALPSDYPFVNGELGKKSLSEIISKIFKDWGPSTVARTLDAVKDIGFKYATVFGATIGIDDIKIPEKKEEIIAKAKEKVNEIHMMAAQGRLSSAERYNRIINEWTEADSKISNELFELLKKDKGGFNSVFIMADSGARGSKQQIKQLSGMRGLMAKPSGEIIEFPIVSNFKEGLNVLEYFISTHGARKGLADTALKTADAGYLTRRLVDIAQDVVIRERDCGTINGIEISPLMEGEEIIEKLSDRIVGRYLSDDVIHPQTGDIVATADDLVTDEIAEEIERCGLEIVKIRSVLTCESERGVCAKCYGLNLATNQEVEMGEAVGTIAAQSIGQPGTQLTMRTFHIGGIAAGQIKEDSLKLNYDAIVRSLPENKLELGGGKDVANFIIPRKGKIVLQRVVFKFDKSKITNLKVKDGDILISGDLVALDENGLEIKAEERVVVEFNGDEVMLFGVEHEIDAVIGSHVYVKEGDFVAKNQVISKFDPYSEPIIAEKSGTVKFDPIEKGVNAKERYDETSGKVELITLEVKEEEKQPRILILGDEDDSYLIQGGAIIVAEDGSVVKVGDILAKVPRELTKTRDITGGLPRVAELFEARKPKEGSNISAIDGYVNFDGTSKNKKVIRISNDFDEDFHHIPMGKHIIVREGDYIKSGDRITDGAVNPHDILRVKGEQALMGYLLTEIQDVYRLQGVKINDKHIGVIVRQMLRKVRIVDVGDTDLIVGQQINKVQFGKENGIVIGKGGKPASAEPVLLGLTKASITIESFISAASFQETTKVLTNASIQGKRDDLIGLKENVIIGHKIPAGTGLSYYDNVKVTLPEFQEQKKEVFVSDKEEIKEMS